LKPLVLGAIMGHFQSGHPVMTEASATDGSQDIEEDDSVIRQIKDLIDTRVRPAVAQDGGDIVYKGFEDGVVYLQMQGACSGCPSSTATLKGGIENMLRHYVPEVEEVRAV
jgi:Fe-S cluster biogenesis protein NfuA